MYIDKAEVFVKNEKKGNGMEILTVKDASTRWGNFYTQSNGFMRTGKDRRSIKASGVWILPANAVY